MTQEVKQRVLLLFIIHTVPPQGRSKLSRNYFKMSYTIFPAAMLAGYYINLKYELPNSD